MNHLIRSHNSKGRIKTIIKNAPIELWYNIFDQEITNAIIQHPFVEQFTWIRPNCENVDMEEPLLQHIVGSKFYLFENIFPNSIISIPFIQESIVNNNAAFISLPNLLIDSNCTFSVFHKQTKVPHNEEISELLAIIRTPNTLFRNVINVDKFMKQPPHMKKTNYFSFHKIELNDKSYWNDKSEKLAKLHDNFQGNNLYEEYFSSVIDEVPNAHTELYPFFFNPLLNDSKNIIHPNNYKKNDKYRCIFCTVRNITMKDYCYCSAIQESKNPPTEPSCKSFSYDTKGLGNNPFYLSLQKQFGPSFFTKTGFLCYFDKENLFDFESETQLLKNLETILCLNGSPNAKITPINVKLITEQIDKKLIEGKGYNSKSLNIVFESNETNNKYLSEMLIFIDLNIVASLMQISLNAKISNTKIFEQIIEYFDILIHQNLFSDHLRLINPLYCWDSRFEQSSNTDIFDISEVCNILKFVSFKEAPKEIIKLDGLLRPTILQRLIWFATSQVATGTYLWSLIHLKGVENSPVSINYKPRFNDENKNSVNDLYLLIFRINGEINILCMSVVNHNDANL
ncbi:uncharacterized protein cubi_00230 [Cryptosporidium ubiquitum]|uniref:Uncharacterized protein n=1 Tax=Cryptosporidium ubiquitum TaxID=857276 RepID=A0A1J4MP72_9CRYT|nr:uncharacterized protein cubi_00230 [Cryptosporidium ubiquitum]OII74677.1 hypothetical protein cubi_00230 [Cryptosporidium ubiquitum]